MTGPGLCRLPTKPLWGARWVSKRAKLVGPTDEAASNEWQDPTLAGKIGDRKAAVCMCMVHGQALMEL